MMSDEKDRVKRNGISFTVNAEWEGGEVQVVAGGLGVTVKVLARTSSCRSADNVTGS